jgi:hypothetical protein
VTAGGQRLYAVECKAEHKNKELDPAYVKKFYCETVPSMIREKSKQCVPTDVYAEIWTSGQVGDEARERLKKLSLPANYHVELRGLSEVQSLIPKNLPACARLLTAISAPPAEIG